MPFLPYSPLTLYQRRLVMAGLTLCTFLTLGTLFFLLLKNQVFGLFEGVMLLLFLCTLPWLSVNFWCIVIGFLLTCCSRNPLKIVRCSTPPPAHPPVPLNARTAIIMPVRNEDPRRIIRNLGYVIQTLQTTSHAKIFHFFLLSDSTHHEIVQQEKHALSSLKNTTPLPKNLHYHQRKQQKGYKAGNVQNFVDEWHEYFEYFIILDADCVMSAEKIIHLVQTMEVNKRIGILQSLFVGFPTQILFTRLFQFSFRYAIRLYALGCCWWQGEECPYWGHNAIIRMKPFYTYCRLPVLSGSPPWGGHIISHDYLEAALMKRGGYEVHLLPEEEGSYEENPPTLVDFILREYRWAIGNIQYLRVLGLSGLSLIGRLQLFLAIWRYMTPLFWYSLMCLILIRHFIAVEEPLTRDIGYLLVLPLLSMSFLPKILGIVSVLFHIQNYRHLYRKKAKAKLLLDTVFETLHAHIMTCIVSFSLAVFVLRLFCGKTHTNIWQRQYRDSRHLTLKEGYSMFWLHTYVGIVLTFSLYIFEPSILPWLSLITVSLMLSIPFVVVTSRTCWWSHFCMTPEEYEYGSTSFVKRLILHEKPLIPETSTSTSSSVET